MTAIEWLMNYLDINRYWIGNDLLEAAEQAKQMEKQQIIEAYCQGCKDIFQDDTIFPRETSEKYYSETYGK